MNAGELVPYTTAEHLAAEYRECTARIREAANILTEQSARLQAAFSFQGKFDRCNFLIELAYGSGSQNTRKIDDILHSMKLAAWGAIIEKLNIRRLMSSKRIKELDEALGRSASGRYQGRRGDDNEGPPNFPEITPETIIAVASGFVASANEFLEEAVAEEYDFWRPRQADEYKTNAVAWKLTRKIIRGWIVEHGYGGSGYRCNYSYQAHVTALDNIFHMLDGKGPVPEYKGSLVSAIETSPDGRGETDYFRFKCYGNRNLHLEFKRQDLLDMFNQIAAKSDRLGQVKGRRAG
jgi:hypothetical protein